jgi:hypothetical protein
MNQLIHFNLSMVVLSFRKRYTLLSPIQKASSMFAFLTCILCLGIYFVAEITVNAPDTWFELADCYRNGLPEKPVAEPVVVEYQKAVSKYNRYLQYRDSIFWGKCAVVSASVVGLGLGLYILVSGS